MRFAFLCLRKFFVFGGFLCLSVKVSTKFVISVSTMDRDLYDEFGNYIGPELDSDEEDDDMEFQQNQEREEPEDVEMEEEASLIMLF
jgi:hypothetical protein